LKCHVEPIKRRLRSSIRAGCREAGGSNINSTKASSKVKMFTPDVWHKNSAVANFCTLPYFSRGRRCRIYKLFARARHAAWWCTTLGTYVGKLCFRLAWWMHICWHILTPARVPVGCVVDVVVDVRDVPKVACEHKNTHINHFFYSLEMYMKYSGLIHLHTTNLTSLISVYFITKV